MKLCKHAQYKAISNIREPKYSTNEVLINVNSVPPNVKHLIIKFSHCKSMPDWFYLDADVVRKSKKQKNGAGMMYVTSLNKKEDFTPVEHCSHDVF